MNRFPTTLLAASLLLGASQAAHAQRLSAISAGKFYQGCQARGGQTVCDAYISGLADGVTLSESSVGKDSDGKPKVAPAICVPQGSGAMLRQRVMGWLSGHTDKLQGDVGPAVRAALLDLFPCKAGAGAE